MIRIPALFLLGAFLTFSPASEAGESVIVIESARAGGTAFEVDRGLVTAAHVAEEGPLRAVFDGRRVPLRVLRVDRAADLALLEGFDPPGPALRLAEAPAEPGEPVLAFGNGLGRSRIAVKQGIISSVDEHVLETDAAINPGDSGGPLVREDGSVVGVVLAKQDGEGVALAVGAARVRQFLAGAGTTAPSIARRSAARPDDSFGLVAAGAGATGGLVVLAVRYLRRRTPPRQRIIITLDPETGQSPGETGG